MVSHHSHRVLLALLDKLCLSWFSRMCPHLLFALNLVCWVEDAVVPCHCEATMPGFHHAVSCMASGLESSLSDYLHGVHLLWGATHHQAGATVPHLQHAL